MPQTLEELGLAKSRLNERYHSVDQLGIANRAAAQLAAAQAAANAANGLSSSTSRLNGGGNNKDGAGRMGEWDPTHSTPVNNKTPMGDR